MRTFNLILKASRSLPVPVSQTEVSRSGSVLITKMMSFLMTNGPGLVKTYRSIIILIKLIISVLIAYFITYTFGGLNLINLKKKTLILIKA